MNTRIEFWKSYRNEINSNARLQKAVLLSNNKLNILYKRLIQVFPEYEKKYKINLIKLGFILKEKKMNKSFSLHTIKNIIDEMNVVDNNKNFLRVISKIDFSSHELDNILQNIKNRKNKFKEYKIQNNSEIIMHKQQKYEFKNQNTSNFISIAIDGPSGTGKSTIAKIISKKYNLNYLNTGLIYRAIALNAINKNFDLSNERQLENSLKNGMIKILPNEIILLYDIDVSKKIKSSEIAKAASQISIFKNIRKWAVKLQQEYSKNKNIIMDGRDTTFRVLPNADIKIYLDTSQEERAKRRFKQNKLLGFSTNYESVLEYIKERDEIDQNRIQDPLHIAKNVKIIDSTNLSIDETVLKISKIIDKVEQKNE